MKKVLRTMLCTLPMLSLLLALTACSGSKTDIQFQIYNQSTATIYRISLSPGPDHNDSDEIVLYDDFDDHIPAGSAYLADASIPEGKMSGTWRIYVNVKWAESGASTFQDFEMNKDIYGFSMHDLDGGRLGIMAHYEPYDLNGGANDRGGRDDANDYQPSEGEYEWRGMYNRDDEYFLEIFNFNGSEFDFVFYLPGGSGERVVRLEGTAEIDPENAKDANYEGVNFYYSESSLFITNSGNYQFESGIYFREGGNGEDEAAGGGEDYGDDSGSGGSSDAAEGDSPLVLGEFYYLNGEFGNPTLYFFSDGSVDYDDDDTTVEAVYIVEQGEKLVISVDGETWLILTIVDETTLADYITDEPLYVRLD